MNRKSGVAPWALLAAALWAPAASAYPWMIKHGYSGCGVCHADPSGSGLLTEYGRAQSELLLATNFGGTTSEEASPRAQFLFGLLKVPDWLLLALDYRGAELVTRATTLDQNGKQLQTVTDRRFVQMVADASAEVRIQKFLAAASVGWMPQTAGPASLTHRAAENVVSRVHWVGFEPDDSVLIRAGRMNLPFGLRNVEHTSWVRSSTRTDTNTSQQDGVAVFYGNDQFRGELMAIVGNFQLSPDSYRERGYSAYAETMVGPNVALGLSSLVTRADRDLVEGRPSLRQAHGAFARIGLGQDVALLAEGDVFLKKQLGGGPPQASSAGLIQLDWEPVSGVHLVPTLEALQQYGDVGGVATGEWFTAEWWPVPQVDLRVDLILRQVPQSLGSTSSVTGLFQLHVYL